MGREIKFRAWDKSFKRMFVPSQIDYELGGELEDSKKENVHVWRKPFDGENANWSSSGHYIHGKDVELMQYTGLKDKNGREIYEGDIVLEDYFSNVNPNDHSDDEYIDDTPRKFIICYDSNQGRYKAVPPETYRINAGNGGWTGYDVRGYKAEVIGNIYENPELIEV
ncbi:YopX family protein [Paenibacillus sp. FSL H7-0357]|uniref:YopX family protein n=1 Tax=Paenibacillus sp. FSL H7-0357 TaxID=1536774 RepID=UPI00068F8B88|nr:YopX family protein [Paenibacillus sp. FSL H7-0357]